MSHFSTILTGEEEAARFTLMVQIPPKKGPRMTVASHASDRTKDFGRDEHEIEINDFILKVSKAIEDARSKMSDEEREEADRKAKTILENATSDASGSRRSA